MERDGTEVPLVSRAAHDQGAGDPMILHVGWCIPRSPPNTGNVIRLCANTGAPCT
jgi:hypothetical protein